MNKKRYCVLCLILCMVFSMLAGCENDNVQDIEYVIGISQANMQEPWRLVLTAELKEEAKKYPNVRLVFMDAVQSSLKQINDIDTLLKYGIDLLIVSPCDTKELTPTVRSVYQDIPVIVLDKIVEEYTYSLFIGPDNYRIGRQAGQAVLKAAETIKKDTITVLEIFADYNSQAVLDRRNGFSQTLTQNQTIVSRELIIPNQLKDTAEDAIISYNGSLGEIDIICAHSDDVALGVYRALSKLGLLNSIQIISIDGYSGVNGGLDLVKKEMIHSTITTPTGGREAIQSAMEILNSISGVPKQIILRSHIVTKANVDDYEHMITRNKQETPQNIRVGYAQVGTESLFRAANNKSIKDAAAAASIELIVNNADQSQQRQLDAVRSFIEQKVDVIVISPVVSPGWDDILAEAKQAGIPVLLSDRSIEVAGDDMFMTFIGADFIEEGRRAMRWILNNVPAAQKDIHIMELQGTVDATPTVERKLGFEAVLAEVSGYEIIYSKVGDYTFEGGKKIIEEYLAKNAWDIDVIFSHNDDMALGAILALEENDLNPGEEIKIVSVDGTREALKAIVAKKLNCSVECNPLLGPQLMKAIIDLMSGKELPLRIITDETVFTLENAKSALSGRKY